MTIQDSPVFAPTQLLTRLRAQRRRLTWKNLRRRVARLFYYGAEERIYRMAPAEALDLPKSEDFARDSWNDLQAFVPSEGRHSRATCLADWRARLDRGERVYTRVEDQRLVSYGWLIERQKTSQLGWAKQALTLPDNSAVLYDYYTLPEYRHRDFYQRLLMHAMHEAALVPGTQWIYLGVRADDRVPRWWVERLGFTYCESYFLRRVLWREKKWRAVA